MKGRMISLILITLLVLVTFSSAITFFYLLRNNYRNYNLLRIDPLETGGLKSNDLEADLKKSDIWMLGDSRMRRWNKELLNNNVEKANLGIEGQTSAQVYYRFRTYLETDTPSLVIVEVGINELKIIGLDKDLSASITEHFYNNMESMVQVCRDKNIPIILMNIFPVGKIEFSRRLIWKRGVNETIKVANIKLRSFCDDSLVYYFDAYSVLSEDGETVNPEYQADFLHINERGYEALSRKLNGQIKEIFK